MVFEILLLLLCWVDDLNMPYVSISNYVSFICGRFSFVLSFFSTVIADDLILIFIFLFFLFIPIFVVFQLCGRYALWDGFDIRLVRQVRPILSWCMMSPTYTLVGGAAHMRLKCGLGSRHVSHTGCSVGLSILQQLFLTEC